MYNNLGSVRFFPLYLFLYFFCTLTCITQASYPSTKEVCQTLLMEMTGIISRVSISEAKRQEWIRHQPKKFQSFADKITSQIKIHSRKEFLENFKKSIEEFKKTLQPNDKILFVFDDGYDDFKSGNWLLGYLYSEFPELSYLQSIRTGKLKEIKGLTDQDTRIVYVDDAVYQASNLSGAIHSIRAFTPHKTIEALIPYYTAVAQKKLKEIGITKTYFQQQLFSLREKIDFQGVTIPTLMEDWVFYFTNDLLDHKLPDTFSFPSFISNGEIFNKSGNGFTDLTIPFINNPLPPYKQVDRLRIDPERRDLLESFK